MFEFFRRLFETDFIPRVFELRAPGLVTLHVLSDALIAVAYFVIPLGLLRLVQRRPDFSFHWIIGVFSLFTFSCGATHVLSIITLWVPVYRLEELLKVFTAIASVGTAAVLIRLVPQIANAASPAQWRRANQLLMNEIEERANVERKLKVISERLKVALRFAKMAVWDWQIENRTIIWHGSVEEVFGVSVDRLSTFSALREMIHPEDRGLIEQRVSEVIADGRKFGVEFRVICPDGNTRWLAGEGGVMLDEQGRPFRMAGVSFDISDRKLAEQRLEISELHFRELAEAMPQIIWTTNALGELNYFNNIWYEYTGLPAGTTEVSGWQLVVHPDDLEASVEATDLGFASGNEFQLEARVRRASDGMYRWHRVRGVPFHDDRGGLLRWFGTTSDIHTEKEENARLEREVLSRTSALQQSFCQLQLQEEQLRRSLAEKETLLREVHHRVKNNLQVISSLLRMQASVLADHQAREALKESQRRVRSMALIHERLYGSHQMDQIDFAEYARALVSDLINSYAGATGHVTSQFRTSCVLLKIDQAIPCGLILNELVTNSLKYAYPSGKPGQIYIHLEEMESDKVRMTVSDSGVGLPEGFDWKNSKSMGLPIVEILAKQIGGDLTVRSQPGTTFTLDFPRAIKEIAVAEVA